MGTVFPPVLSTDTIRIIMSETLTILVLSANSRPSTVGKTRSEKMIYVVSPLPTGWGLSGMVSRLGESWVLVRSSTPDIGRGCGI